MNWPPRSLADSVKRRARELGFSLVGITSAEPFEIGEQRHLAWLRKHHQAGMAWMNEDRARRAHHPAALLDGARSLVVVGVPYGRRHEPECPDASRPRGRVARYARGKDYHDAIGQRLQRLAAYLREVGGAETRTRIFVDSSPLAEREAAARAGIGFFGKNTNLLTPIGSWVFLGAILTTLELPADEPVVKGCGQCRLCLEACPTDALPEPYVLDANRCIAYLTIEHRGSIEPSLRPLLADHIFGCDICQEVCPWNRGRSPMVWPEFAGALESARPVLEDVLALEPESFRARFGGTPVTRAKYRGLLRNAAIALGNVGGPDAVPVLARALSHEEPLVRGHAAWALGQIGGLEAADALRRARDLERDDGVRSEIDAALGQLSADAPLTSRSSRE